MKSSGVAILTAAFLLFACSQEADRSAGDEKVAADIGGDHPQIVAGERSLADTSEDGSARETQITTGTMPARFHGMWDFVDGTCMATSDLRLEIGPDILVFYESTGAVTGVKERADGGVEVKLAMSGEGENWEETNSYRLANDGKTLITAGLRGPSGGELRRKRCTA